MDEDRAVQAAEAAAKPKQPARGNRAAAAAANAAAEEAEAAFQDGEIAGGDGEATMEDAMPSKKRKERVHEDSKAKAGKRQRTTKGGGDAEDREAALTPKQKREGDPDPRKLNVLMLRLEGNLDDLEEKEMRLAAAKKRKEQLQAQFRQASRDAEAALADFSTAAGRVASAMRQVSREPVDCNLIKELTNASGTKRPTAIETLQKLEKHKSHVQLAESASLSADIIKEWMAVTQQEQGELNRGNAQSGKQSMPAKPPQGDLASSGAPSGRAMGLQNLGNSCYLNSVLAALCMLEGFAGDLLAPELRAMKFGPDSVFLALLDAVQRQRGFVQEEDGKTDGTIPTPQNLKTAVGRRNHAFANNGQEDAHEFLCACLDNLADEVLPPERFISQTKCPSQRNFTCVICVSVECSKCNAKSERKELFRSLSLELPSGGKEEFEVDLNELLQAHFRVEEVSDHTCEQCNSKGARLQRRLWRLPRTLILHLKRFRAGPGAGAALTKIQRRTSRPQTLDLGALCCSSGVCPPPAAARVPSSAPGRPRAQMRGSNAASPAAGYSHSDKELREGIQRAIQASLADEQKKKEGVGDTDPARQTSSSSPPPPPLDAASTAIIAAASDAEPGELRVGDAINARYHLRAAVCHHGTSADHGHYYADVLHQNHLGAQWMRHNDERVDLVAQTSAEDLAEDYILFYDAEADH